MPNHYDGCEDYNYYPMDIEPRPESFWDYFWMDQAKTWSLASKDPSTKVGAVLVDENNVLVATGFNGFPRGVYDSQQRYDNRELKYKFIMHAEANAVINAGHRARGATIYVYPSFGLPPLCTECAKLVIQAGVKEVVGFVVNPSNADAAARWKSATGTLSCTSSPSWG
jgi:dCMP deaminase